MTRTGDQEIGAVSGRLSDNPGELACMLLHFFFVRAQTLQSGRTLYSKKSHFLLVFRC